MKRTIGRIVILGLVAATIHAQADTYYLQSDGDHPAPYPFNIYGQLEPVMTLDANRRIYLVEDTAQDRADLQKFMNQTSGTMEPLDAPAPPGGGGTNTYTYTFTYQPPTNGLYLTWDGFSDGLAGMTLHGGTNLVYVALSSTNLSTPLSQWNIAGEIFPTDTNATPFTVEMSTEQNVFYDVEDWSDAMTNGLYCWWAWLYYGNLLESASDLDSSGHNTLGEDFTNDVDPNVISFSLSTTNQYADTSDTTVQVNIDGGRPFYFAVLVDDTNDADADWINYVSSNIVVNLGLIEGWHQVYVGLRGLPSDAYQTWESIRLKLDLTPPLLIITNPMAAIVTRPVVQLKGYSFEPLANLSYDLTNATGLVTNQQALILGQYYDTNTLEFTTNFFQCFDIPLTNGENIITLHALDLAGNTLVTNLTYTLDDSQATNPPLIRLDWPQSNTQISGNRFTWRGWISDPTAQLTAQTVDTNGFTNSISGQVGRDGNFKVENIPLSNGTNDLLLTAADAAGNISTTNIFVIKSDLVLTITSADFGGSVTGTISGTNANGYTIWVNGTMATNNGDGTWIAQDPHLTLDSSVVQVRAIPNSDNGGYGEGGGQ